MSQSLVHSLTALVTAFVITACVAPVSKVTEADIRQRLPGTWGFEREFLFGGGSFEKTYFANGTAKGQVLLWRKANKAIVHLPPVKFTSKWRVSGTTLTSYDVQSNNTDFLPPGKEYVDRIIDITADELVYQDVTHGSIQKDKRISPGSLKSSLVND